MEILVRTGFAVLALLHVMPALVLFQPGLSERLYDVPAGSDLSLLIRHRGALFGVVVLTAAWAVLDPAVRGVACVALAVSMASFVILYWQAGLPTGALRTIAIADVAGLLVLAVLAAISIGGRQ